MLTLLLLIPLLGSLIILPMSNTKGNKNQGAALQKKIALITSLINFFISLFLWYEFDSNCATQFQFVQEFNQLNFCHLNFGVDGISLYFVLLTTFITPIALLSNYTNIQSFPKDPNGGGNNLKLFLISFLVLETLQICAFVSLDLLLFYIFFESVLPILFIVIVIFGHGKDRFRSAFLFFLYTLAGSLPMLLSILVLYSYIGNTDFQLISLYDISLESQKLLWLSLPFSKVDMTSRDLKIFKTLHSSSFKKKDRKKWLLENKECTELVIHGSNLSSTVNYLYYNNIVRHMVKIPSNLNSFLTGIIISDGFLKKTNSGNIILIFKQSVKNFDFLFICFFKLAHFCQGYPRLDITHLNGKIHYLILFQTRALPCFKYWHELFYVNNKKIVPSLGNKMGEFYNLLDYEALAY